MIRTQVRSSNIVSIGYADSVLEIAFVQGGIYQYNNVPEHVFHALMNAPSKGRYFDDVIKDRYRCRKVAL